MEFKNKIYIVVDNKAKDVCDCFYANCKEVAIRFMSGRVQLALQDEAKNIMLVSLLKDCDLYEMDLNTKSMEKITDIGVMFPKNEKDNI